MLTISLHCIAGPMKGQTFRLHGGPVFIFGRYAKSHFSLAADPAASHIHFLIDTSENRVRVIDLGSTNGLVINERHLGGKLGTPFTDFVTLRSGDTVLAGACLFRLNVTDESTVHSIASLQDPAANVVLSSKRRLGRDGNLTAVIAKKAIPPATESGTVSNVPSVTEIVPGSDESGGLSERQRLLRQ